MTPVNIQYKPKKVGKPRTPDGEFAAAFAKRHGVNVRQVRREGVERLRTMKPEALRLTVALMKRKGWGW